MGLTSTWTKRVNYASPPTAHSTPARRRSHLLQCDLHMKNWQRVELVVCLYVSKDQNVK